MTLRFLLVAIAFTLFPSTLQAQYQCSLGDCGPMAPTMEATGSYEVGGDVFDQAGADGGLYLSLMLGGSMFNDQQSTGFQRQVDTDFNTGSAVGGALGLKAGKMRYEVEYTFRNNTPNDILFNGNSVPASTIGGRQVSHSGMFNAAIDFGNGRNLRPYVGGGVGFAFIDSDLRYGGLPARLNGQDNAFAAQAFAGISKSMRTGAEFFVEYRFFTAVNPKLNRFGGPAINGAPQNIILDSHYDAHNVMFGIRRNF